ncbi:hypothetical protein [Piscinibacter terrae]|uniref:Uncharacterized protein n=1 Tax=Piscinibacter terrae TaxID=2496871 RepID=A0A3N7JKS8_9BURK|nr:hypothetical protein [Albitalea terrae]RQP21909.1 hypothetical protein DZC73_26075 [Albitalea terrae]
MALYFAVPVIRDDNGAEDVFYYAPTGRGPDRWKTRWTRVDPPVLNSKSQDATGDLLMLVQPSEKEIRQFAPDHPQLDPSVTLFAGVAKTLGSDNLLPNFYMAQQFNNLPAVVVSVVEQTRRGLILTFVRRDILSNMVPPPIVGLMASTDPEIKNSTDGV